MAEKERKTEQQIAIENQQVCGLCKSRFPNYAPIMVVMPPEPVQIQIAGQKKVAAVNLCICNNPRSENYQHVLAVTCSCEHFDPVQQKIKVSSKLAGQIKGN